MSKPRQNNQALGGLLLLGLGLVIGIYILKWLAITVAILVVPFTAWWVWDWQQRRSDVDAGAT